MKTPICDFVRVYAGRDPLRLHMPGHKGVVHLGPEPYDLTEIPGADVLYHAEGVIRESEENAARLFGSARTLYSTEGSSQCVRAMLYLALQYARQQGRGETILAGRNAHQTFLTGAGLLGLDVRWLYGESLLTCDVAPDVLDAALRETNAAAVYLTSPDYLGHCAELSPLAAVCRRHGALLLVDHAHGAYRKFLPSNQHALDAGADLCCDSAHKTLPVLTGGAYLHLSKTCPPSLIAQAEQAMRLFSSTSPSYVILESLDYVNQRLASDWPSLLRNTAARLDRLKQQLLSDGWTLFGDEPLKLTICPKSRGYTGKAVAEYLQRMEIWCEFSDPDYVVCMFSPDTPSSGFARLQSALAALPVRETIGAAPPPLPEPTRVLSIREALLAPNETLPLSACEGRVLAAPSVACPPAVPILTCGERITPEALRVLRYYGTKTLNVVKNPAS